MVETMVRVFLSLIWSKNMPKEKIEWNTFLSFGENKSDFMSLFGKYLQTYNGIDLVVGLKITFFGIRTLWINRKGSGRYVQKYLTKYHTLLPCQPQQTIFIRGADMLLCLPEGPPLLGPNVEILVLWISNAWRMSFSVFSYCFIHAD